MMTGRIPCLLLLLCLVTRSLSLRGPLALLHRVSHRRSSGVQQAQTVEEHLAENRLDNEKELLVAVGSTVRDCVTHLRAQRRRGNDGRLTELGRIWVVDDQGRFGGYVGASELLLSEPSVELSDLVQQSDPVIQSHEDLEDTLVRLSTGGVAVAPVVNENGVFVGALSPTEIMQEIQLGDTADVSKYAGSGSQETYFGATGRSVVWNRATWLLSLLALQSVSSAALGSYADLLHRHLSLALFLTMLTGTAGNAGNQSSAMVIRGLATGEINPKADFFRVARREALLGMPLGLLLGVASFGRVLLSAKQGAKYVLPTAFVVGVSMTITVLSAILVGTVTPMILDSVGVDPCNCASPALATVVDLLGVVVMCSIGIKILP